MTTTPPGWYDDGHGSLRWWDGDNWTEHTATPEAEPAPQEPTAPIAPSAQEWTVPLAPTAPYAPVQQTAPTVPLYPGYGLGDTAQYPGSAAYPAEAGLGAPAAVEPPRSKLWIVWVVLGVVLVGILITAAILLPMLFTSLSSETDSGTDSGTGSGSESSEPSDDGSSESGGGGAPSEADEQAAIDAVLLYNDAWLTADCDGYFASTTEDFRNELDITTCEAFQEESQSFAGSVDDYQTEIGDVQTIGSAVTVSTSETYSSRYDYDGNETPETLDYEDHYEYVVERTDSGWGIDSFYSE